MIGIAGPRDAFVLESDLLGIFEHYGDVKSTEGFRLYGNASREHEFLDFLLE